MADYISREAIIDELEEEIEAGNILDEDALINRGLKIALKDVKAAEAADVQPVKRGKWFHINNDGFIYCSECNNEAYWDTDYGQQLFDFCPYCGAKMTKQ